MKKKIILTDESLVRFDNFEPFFMQKNSDGVFEEDLTLCFENYHDLTNASVTFYNGSKEKTLKFEKTINVPAEVLFTGQLRIGVDMFIGKNKVKHWDVLPLAIYEAENGYRLLDYFEDVETRIKSLENEITELKKQNEIIL